MQSEAATIRNGAFVQRSLRAPSLAKLAPYALAAVWVGSIGAAVLLMAASVLLRVLPLS